MSTATRAPKQRTCRLTQTAGGLALVLREQRGAVKQVDAYFLQSTEDGYKLNKADCTSYTVSLVGQTPSCTCKGYTFRRTCKHVDCILKLIDLDRL